MGRRWRWRRRCRDAAGGAGDSADILDRQAAADLPRVQPRGGDALPLLRPGQRRARRAPRVRHEDAHELDQVNGGCEVV